VPAVPLRQEHTSDNALSRVSLEAIGPTASCPGIARAVGARALAFAQVLMITLPQEAADADEPITRPLCLRRPIGRGNAAPLQNPRLLRPGSNRNC